MKRTYFILVGGFWAVMNVLLWRAEVARNRQAGSPVPLMAVWQRILTAPDDSAMRVLHQGRQIGYCRWVAKVDEEDLPPRTGSGEEVVEGRVKRLTGYTVELEGNVRLDTENLPIRFQGHAAFDTNHVWRNVGGRLSMRPASWEVRADAAKETITFKQEGTGHPGEQSYTFAQLASLQAWLPGLAAAGLPGSLAEWIGEPPGGPSRAGLGLVWEARQDWMELGHTPVRVYRLRTRVLDRYEATVLVSRVGEILRVELPNGFTMENEAMVNW